MTKTVDDYDLLTTTEITFYRRDFVFLASVIKDDKPATQLRIADESWTIYKPYEEVYKDLFGETE